MEHIPHPWIKEREKTGPRLTKDEQIGFSGQLALFVTNVFGSMGSFYVLTLWMVSWIIFASLGVGFFSQDPYPFTFLLFLSNIVQLLALPILAVGQQVLSRASDKQAEQTFKDAEAILKLQDEVNKLMKINNQLTQEIHDAILKNKNS